MNRLPKWLEISTFPNRGEGLRTVKQFKVGIKLCIRV